MRAKGCGKLFRQSLQSARLQYSASTNCFLFSYTYMAQTGNSLSCSLPQFSSLVALGHRSAPAGPARRLCNHSPRAFTGRTRAPNISRSLIVALVCACGAASWHHRRKFENARQSVQNYAGTLQAGTAEAARDHRRGKRCQNTGDIPLTSAPRCTLSKRALPPVCC